MLSAMRAGFTTLYPSIERANLLLHARLKSPTGSRLLSPQQGVRADGVGSYGSGDVNRFDNTIVSSTA
jgi:hypothetical protein